MDARIEEVFKILLVYDKYDRVLIDNVAGIVKINGFYQLIVRQVGWILTHHKYTKAQAFGKLVTYLLNPVWDYHELDSVMAEPDWTDDWTPDLVYKLRVIKIDNLEMMYL